MTVFKASFLSFLIASWAGPSSILTRRNQANRPAHPQPNAWSTMFWPFAYKLYHPFPDRCPMKFTISSRSPTLVVIWPWISLLPSICLEVFLMWRDNTVNLLFSSAWDNTACQWCSGKPISSQVPHTRSSPTSVTSGWPMVLVPVLSNKWFKFMYPWSKLVPFLISEPLSWHHTPSLTIRGVAGC